MGLNLLERLFLNSSKLEIFPDPKKIFSIEYFRSNSLLRIILKMIVTVLKNLFSKLRSPAKNIHKNIYLIVFEKKKYF